jgi:uncharacterized membrane protein required for colicin V production
LLDFIFIILCVRISYIAITRGVLKELFKILGLVCSSLFAFHWYPFLADKIEARLAASPVPLIGGKSLYFISFLLLLLLLFFAFAFLSMISTSLTKKEEISLAEKRLAFFMGLFRAVFLSSVMLFVIYLSPLHPKIFESSLSYRTLKKVAPGIYLGAIRIYNLVAPAKPSKEVKAYYEAKRHLPEDSKSRD